LAPQEIDLYFIYCPAVNVSLGLMHDLLSYVTVYNVNLLDEDTRQKLHNTEKSSGQRASKGLRNEFLHMTWSWTAMPTAW
jgi:hypothetical protein